MPAVLLVPGTVAMVLLGTQAARVAFFDNSPTESRAIAQVMIAMMLGLVPFGWLYLIQRVFYAFEDAKTPFYLQVVVTVVATVANLVAAFVDPAHTGIVVGLGQTVSNLVAAHRGLRAAARAPRLAAAGQHRPHLPAPAGRLGGRRRARVARDPPDGGRSEWTPHRGPGRWSSWWWAVASSWWRRWRSPTSCASRRSPSCSTRCCAGSADVPRDPPDHRMRPARAALSGVFHDSDDSQEAVCTG